MPLIADENQAYRPPFWLRNGHLHTVYPYLLADETPFPYTRTRIETDDGDFIDLDFSKVGSKSLLVALHGLEGSSQSIYIKSLVRQANQQGWDAVAVNQRGCSGEPNRLYSAYHSGKSDDLLRVVKFLTAPGTYDALVIVGFSLGGNITLKFMGEQGSTLPPQVKGAVAISVPCDLVASSRHLCRPQNKLYMARFMKTLRAKALQKKEAFPQAPFTEDQIRKTRDFVDYDNLYTAPAHGFRDAMDYWQKCSSKQFLPQIARPTLLIQALDDPFLPEAAHPFKEAQHSSFFHLLAVRFGGHVGFVQKNGRNHPRWHEEKALTFLAHQL